MIETLEGLSEYLSEENPEAIVFDGFDKAIIGVAKQHTRPPLVVYDPEKIIECLMDQGIESYDDAVDYYEFNIACLWAGEGTPLLLDRLEPKGEDPE